MTETRLCKECLLSKSIDDFHNYSNGSKAYKCKDCHKESERKRLIAFYANNPEAKIRRNLSTVVSRAEESINTIAPTQICKVCCEIKNKEDFPKCGNHKLNTCKSCYQPFINSKAKQRYREDAEFRAKKKLSDYKSRLKYRYGVTVEQVVNTLESQHGKCANKACGVEISLTAPKESVKPAVIDHSHITGKFRALLCQSCNTLLGRIEKDRTIVDGLFEYSDRFKET